MFEDNLIFRYFTEVKSRSSGSLIDVGANVGAFFSSFARTGWTVFAFEPEMTNFNALKENYRKYPNVRCIKEAISLKNGKSKFFISTEHPGIHSLVPFDESHKKIVVVDTVRLDDYCVENGIHDIDMIKIDAEGSDFNVIKTIDFRRIKPKLIMCEYMDSRSKIFFGYSHHQVVEYLKKFGYVCFTSKWSRFRDYSHLGDRVENTSFVSFSRNSYDSTGYWGNMVFVPEADSKLFEDFSSYFLENYKKRRAIYKLIPQGIKKYLGYAPFINDFFYA